MYYIVGSQGGDNMYKAYKFRMYPNDSQKILIHKTFGCYRFVYNYFLDKCRTNGYTKAFDMCKELKDMYDDYKWLKEVDSCSLRCAIFNLEDAYKNFFSKKSNYPIFKSKYKRQTYRTNCIKNTYRSRKYSNIQLDLVNHKIKLPKLGLVDIRGYRKEEKINGDIVNATIIKETTGKYYYQVDTYYPSSKTCSRCGKKTEITNKLNIRNWICRKCGIEHDRDINASINIMYEGLKKHYGYS